SDGNVGSATQDFLVDTIAPSVTIIQLNSPTNVSSQTITGTFDETGSDIDSITVNGVIATISGATYSAIIGLTEGTNSIDAIAMDKAGNIGSNSTIVVLDTIAPAITIDQVTSPTNESSQTITGTFDETGSDIASITVNSVTATISAATYSAIIGLTEGTNPVDVIAVDKAGNVGSNSTTIVLDTIAPAANITAPKSNTEIKYFENIIKGNVTDEHLDFAVLTVSNGSGTLTYDLTITDNRFAQRVEFTPDQSNTLELLVFDTAGNSNTDIVVVNVHNNTMQANYNVNDSAPVYIDAVNETDTEIEFYSNVNESVTFTVTAKTDQTLVDELNSSASVFGEVAMGKIVEINVTGLDATNESQVHHVLVKFYYTFDDLDLDGDGILEPGELDEDNMFIYWNESGNWTKLLKGDPLWVLNNGQEKISGDNPGYVWVDVKHLSMFGLVSLPEPKPTEDDGDEDTNGGNGGGGSSSSSGGGASGELYENIACSETDRQFVNQNYDIIYSFELECNIVQFVKFTSLKSAGQVATKVEILKDTSALVDNPPSDIVYKNLNIWVGNSGWGTKRNIADATVVFTVDESWINENNIDESSIALYRYSDDTWHKLVTKKIAEDANSLQFEAETPGFSPFAVTGKTIGEPGGEGIIEPTVTAEKTPIPTPTEKKGIPGFSLFAGLSVLLIAVQLLRKKN
ncbi:MAG: PGF-pre-PGF domain-containing protein, partial [Methanosarcinales archaeon]|nr:PGF-pre-PGF domain-containing protein [Methanosarcinales archaeon]